MFYYDYSTMVRWQGTPTGIPRTVFCLAKELQLILKDFQLVTIDDDLRAFHHVEISGEGASSVGRPVTFVSGDILFSAGANWAFGCYNNEIRRLKALGVNFAQLFYDIIPDLFPYFYEQGVGFGDYFGRWTVETAALCDQSFAISECSRRDIVLRSQKVGVDVMGMKVVRLGEDYIPVNGITVGRYPPGERFLLCVGTLEIRKNQILLLQAYRILSTKYPGRLPKLVLVGRKGWIDGNLEFQVANDRALKELVDVLTDVRDEELDWLYSNCLFTLFPALYEGWGLPVAESFRYGKPCISSNTSSMVEIAPKLTIFASPYSVETWVDQIERLLFDSEVLNMQAEKIIQEYSPSHWRGAAEYIRNQIISGNLGCETNSSRPNAE